MLLDRHGAEFGRRPSSPRSAAVSVHHHLLLLLLLLLVPPLDSLAARGSAVSPTDGPPCPGRAFLDERLTDILFFFFFFFFLAKTVYALRPYFDTVATRTSVPRR